MQPGINNTTPQVTNPFSNRFLPRELTLHICSYLSNRDLINTVPLVCRAAHVIMQDDSLWQQMTIRRFGPEAGQRYFRQTPATNWKGVYRALQFAMREEASRFHDKNVKINAIASAIWGLNLNPNGALMQTGSLHGRRVIAF